MCAEYTSLVTAMKALTQGEEPNTVTLPVAENAWTTRPDAESWGVIALEFEADALHGDNVKVAAGAVVLSELPEGATAVGIPAKVVRQGGKRVANDLDQVNIPDPVQQELNALRAEIAALREQINKVEE